MANSIIDQASAIAANPNRDRSNPRQSISELERLTQEANFGQQAAQKKQEVYQNISQYHSSGAEQEKAQGNQLLRSGSAKKAMGGALIAIGGIMIVIGAAMMIAGGAGAGLLAAGFTSIGNGIGQIIMGAADTANGKAALARYQEKLDLATANHVLSKQENKIVKKEMMRYEIFRQKKEMLEAMTDIMKPMLEEAGIDANEMSEDQLFKFMEKMMEDGADILANGGIFETDLTDAQGAPMFADNAGVPMEGQFFFMRDENTGDFYQIDIARDENGEPVLGANDEPLFDKERGISVVEDGDLKDFLELQFMFADKAAQIASSVGTTDVDDSGNVVYKSFDPYSTQDMKEFAGLLKATNSTAIETGQASAPLKVIIEPDGVYMQEWDYENDIPIGEKIPVHDIGGGDYDRGDIESYENALARSEDALEKLGLNAGGRRFNELASVENFETFNLTSLGGDGTKLSDLTSRDSDAFKDFNNIRTTLDTANAEKDVLAGAVGDKTADGRA